MALHLTSVDPAFDLSIDEIETLADRIECGDYIVRPSELFHRGSTGRLNAVKPRDIATIIAALRAYANG